MNRVKAETGVDRYQPDLWLNAIGAAGYKRVAVQSLHVIPGEEYLSLMNTSLTIGSPVWESLPDSD